MKKVVCFLVAAVSFLFVASAYSAEVVYDPSTQPFDINSNGILSLWGVPAANGNALVANPDYEWPTEISVAAWLSMILKARETNTTVTVGYDPTTLDIWYVSMKP